MLSYHLHPLQTSIPNVNMASSFLSPTSTLLPNTAMLINLFPIGVGSFALLRPGPFIEQTFEQPLPSDPKTRKIALSLARLFGIRAVFMGCAALGAWYAEERKLLGYLVLLGVGVGTVDGLAQRSVTGSGTEWRHLWLVPILVGVGAGLVGWLDGWL